MNRLRSLLGAVAAPLMLGSNAHVILPPACLLVRLYIQLHGPPMFDAQKTNQHGGLAAVGAVPSTFTSLEKNTFAFFAGIMLVESNEKRFPSSSLHETLTVPYVSPNQLLRALDKSV